MPAVGFDLKWRPASLRFGKTVDSQMCEVSIRSGKSRGTIDILSAVSLDSPGMLAES